MSFQGHCVQAMLAAQRTQLSSAQLHTGQRDAPPNTGIRTQFDPPKEHNYQLHSKALLF